MLDGIKPIQLKELTQLCDDLPNIKAQPLKVLRSEETVSRTTEQPLDTIADTNEHENELILTEETIVDAYGMADPVVILSKIPDNFYTLMNSSNWKERKEALDSLLPIVKTPKISSEARYAELISQLAKKIPDSNVLITILSAQCLQAIILGLRSSFIPYMQFVLEPLLEKCKEKKSTILEPLRGALDALFVATGSLHPDFIEKFKTFALHKNPQVKAETIGWIYRGLCTLNWLLPSCSQPRHLMTVVQMSEKLHFLHLHVLSNFLVKNLYSFLSKRLIKLSLLASPI
jgi:cytoskeleton-associated protein 5